MARRTVQVVLESNGKNEARAYAVVALQPAHPEPAAELERVQIVDPRLAATVVTGTVPAGSGPRNPEQKLPSPAKPPEVDLPDALPATKAQRVLIDPEVVARWRAEAKENKEKGA
jgi:hypothetical protein